MLKNQKFLSCLLLCSMLRRQSRLLKLVVGVFLLLAMSSANSSSWTEYRSEHFMLYTDASDEKARQYLQNAEQFRQVVNRFAPLKMAPPLHIVMYNSNSSFRRLIGLHSIGLLLPVNDQSMLLFTAEKDKWLQDDTAREEIIYSLYTLHHLQETRASYPYWFRAMLAELLATARLENNRALVGVTNTRIRWQEAPVIAIAPLLQLTAKSRTAILDHQLWGFGHFLLLGQLAGATNYSAELSQYLTLLADEQPAEQAFVTAFGKTPAALEPELNTYIRRKDLKAAVIPLQPYSGDIATRQIPAAEAKLLQGRIALKLERADIAAEQLKGIAENTTEFAQLQQSIQQAEHLAAELAQWQQKAVKTPQQLAEQADQQQQLAATIAELEQQLKQQPKNASLLAELAQHYMQLNRYSKDSKQHNSVVKKAINYAEKSLKLQPGQQEMHLLLRIAYNGTGNRKKSFEHLYMLHQMNPENLTIKQTVGQFLFNERKYEQALPYLQNPEQNPGCTAACQQDIAKKLETIRQYTGLL